MSDHPLKSKAGDIWRAGILRNPGGEAALKMKVSMDVLIDYVGLVLDLISDERMLNQQLTDRIKVLEDRPDLRYSGVWQQDQVYGSGNFVTDGGSLWHAKRASVGERPGVGDAWQLAVKRGRDGRDAK
jgi:hypothetical protein